MLKRSQDRPSWQEIAPHSDSTNAYCAQWQSLRLLNEHLGVAKNVSHVRERFYWVQCQDVMSRNGAAIVMLVLKSEAHRGRPRHQWQNTMLDLPWSTFPSMYWVGPVPVTEANTF